MPAATPRCAKMAGSDRQPAADDGGRPRLPHWLVWPGTLSFLRVTGASSSWHVLGQPAFRVYFIGSTASNLGTWLQNTAQMLLAYQLTRSAFAVGLVTSVQFAGFVFPGPWAATLADRIGSRGVLIGSQYFSAAVAAALAGLRLSGALTENWLVAGAAATGLAFAFALPTQNAMVLKLVRPGDAKAALAMNSVSYNAGRTLAPLLYLAVLASIGSGWAFAVNAISFLCFAAALHMAWPRAAQRTVRRAPDWAVLRLPFRRPRLLLLLAMVAAVTLADDPVLVLGPAVSHQVLGVSGIWPAFFLSALGLGTVLGALLPVRRVESRQVAIPLLVLGCSVIVFAAGGSPALSLIAALVAGAAGLLTGAATQALLLEYAGPAAAPQVMALWAVAWAGTKPFASVLDGLLGSHDGVLTAAIVLAAPAILIACAERFIPGTSKEKLRTWLRGKARLLARDDHDQTNPVSRLINPHAPDSSGWRNVPADLAADRMAGVTMAGHPLPEAGVSAAK